MELKELCEKTLDLFDCKNVDGLRDKLYKCVLISDIQAFNDFAELVEDLSIDWLQKIYQYYQAERKNKKQDFTPKSICKLCASLTKTGGKTVYDICAGSGAMTIQKWVQNPDKIFICEELDSNVIPYLLFNMAIRNMQGYVINRDVLTKELVKVYKVDKGEEFSVVEEIENAPEIQADEIISNPPYNIKWIAPTPLEADERFKEVIPPSTNANYAFVLTALARLNKGGKCAFVLPNGALSERTETEIRKCIVENGRLEKIISLPDKMFESTTIATCVYVLSENNKTIQMFDCRKKAIQEQRAQNGQFGGASHTNRKYNKTVNVLSDELITNICNKCEDIAEFSQNVTIDEIRNNEYLLIPSRYIKFQEQESKHRPYADIVKNLNDIIRLRNSCKLVINETLSKELKLDIALFKKDIENSKENRKNIETLIGEKLIVDDYIGFTKNKNEICFKSNDKEVLSHLFKFFLDRWSQDIDMLNSMECVYLAELRDALLPDLMSGKLDVSGIELSKKEGG